MDGCSWKKMQGPSSALNATCESIPAAFKVEDDPIYKSTPSFSLQSTIGRINHQQVPVTVRVTENQFPISLMK